MAVPLVAIAAWFAARAAAARAAAAIAAAARNPVVRARAAQLGTKIKDVAIRAKDNFGRGLERIKQACTKASQLSKEQQANLDRYTKKLPAGHGPVKIENVPGGGKVFTSSVPGNVSGQAIYQKTIDAAGKTTAYTKTTLDNAGQVVHIKPKF